MVAGVVVRVFKNSEKTLGIPYPSSKPMQVIASLWNGENWATDGGRSKINWKQSPFIATFKGFALEGHKCHGDSQSSSFCSSSPSSEWWEDFGSGGLSAEQMRQLKWVRRNYMTYDYCADKTRFPKPPPECSVNNV
jgi:xyloglucan:xyloglucosyl transferase